jgi:hypothetical protein
MATTITLASVCYNIENEKWHIWFIEFVWFSLDCSPYDCKSHMQNYANITFEILSLILDAHL